MRLRRRHGLEVGAVLVGAISVARTVDVLNDGVLDPDAEVWIFMGFLFWAVFFVLISAVVGAIWLMGAGTCAVARHLWRRLHALV